ncbi:hypothetical protein VTO73DRAFT_1638 [Trametes versicolor]
MLEKGYEKRECRERRVEAWTPDTSSHSHHCPQCGDDTNRFSARFSEKTAITPRRAFSAHRDIFPVLRRLSSRKSWALAMPVACHPVPDVAVP